MDISIVYTVRIKLLSKLILCLLILSKLTLYRGDLFLESMALSYLLDGNPLRLSGGFLEILDPVASEVVNFELPLLLGLVVNQVMTLLTIRMGDTYILLCSIIFECLNELSDGHVIWLLHLQESDSCRPIEFLSHLGVGDVACLIINFHSTKLNGYHICKVHICQIGFSWELDKSKSVGNREILDSLKFDG